MSAISVWEAPSGEHLRGKGRHWCNCRLHCVIQRLECEILQNECYIHTLALPNGFCGHNVTDRIKGHELSQLNACASPYNLMYEGIFYNFYCNFIIL